MGLEVESKHDQGVGDDCENVLLIFCPTGESEAGKVDVTPRMMELASMGFRHVAITRWDPRDTSYYVICARGETLSEAFTDAILEDAAHIVSEAMNGFDHYSYSSNNNN